MTAPRNPDVPGPTGRDRRHDVLYEPVVIGPKTARNRFWSTAYATGWRMDQVELEVAHRGMRAEGGWGVVIVGEVVFDDHARNPWLEGLELMTNDDVKKLSRIADAVHAHGSLAGAQLAHLGAGADPRIDRIPSLAPSQMQGDGLFFSKAIPKEMDLDDIRAVQQKWIAAARRARDAGFDIVEVHAAHGYLPTQFLTPYHNRRTDGYGGSLANRARFLREVLEGVREAVGSEVVVSVRYPIEGRGVSSLPVDDALQVAAMLDHLVDVWDLAIGSLATADHDLTPSRLYPEGYALQWHRRMREVTQKSVVGTARLTDPDLMASVIASGDLDFIGGARPGIADPFLPRKIEAGQFARVRECIGSNHCARSSALGHMGCSQNPTTGEEARRGWHPEDLPPRPTEAPSVLVVGAGPSGLEAATTLTRRGFDMVHVVDAAPEVGGHMRWFRKLPGFTPWGRVIEHREALLREYPGATFVANTRLTCDDVLAYGAEVVIVATGAPWARTGVSWLDNEPIPGADASLPNVATPEQLMLEGKKLPGTTTVIYDCEGDVTAIALAQALQAQGRQVQIVTPFADVAGAGNQDNVGPVLRGEVIAAGGTLTPATVLLEVTADGAVLAGEGDVVSTVPADGVVLVIRRESDDALYQQLLALGSERLAEAGIREVHRVGDCVAPASLADAIFAGHRIARDLGAASERAARTVEVAAPASR